MNTKKTLIALSAAAALGILGASAALASDRDDSASSAQAERDWQQWQRSLGHAVVPGNGYVDNGQSAYGFATPRTPAHKPIKR